MSLGIRGKLFLTLLSVILLVDVITEVFLENRLRNFIETRVENELHHHARAIREWILLTDQIDSIPHMNEQAHRFGLAIDKRVTLIDGSGRVLGDSELDDNAVRNIDNHGRRPEVQQALHKGYGAARRFSTTIGTDMLYVAVPFTRADTSGVVRVEVSLLTVDRTITHLRLFLLLAGLLGMGMAVLASGIVAHLLTRTLRDLVEQARHKASQWAGTDAISFKNEIHGLATSFHHITREVDESVETLARERFRFEAVLNGMGEAVLALDAQHRITLANRPALELLGLRSLPKEPQPAHILPPELLSKIKAEQHPRDISFSFDLPGRPARRIWTLATPRAATGECVVVMRDITEDHRLEQMRREFVANVSHELRTPVSVILANAETLLDGALADPEAAHAMLFALHRNAQRLSNTVGNLLDLSRLDAGAFTLKPAHHPLLPLLTPLIDQLTPGAQAKSLRLETHIPPSISIFADAQALTQAVGNLLENAIKYTPPGGQVSLAAQHRARGVRITVSDNGPGIPPGHQERLFERFYRVDAGRSREVGGTGLGLAIVKSLMESMGGQVGVSANTPHGAVFYLDFP